MDRIKRIAVTGLTAITLSLTTIMTVILVATMAPISPARASVTPPGPSEIVSDNLYTFSTSSIDMRYDPTVSTNRLLGDDRTLGDEVAWLAVQMAATASPEDRPTNPSHNVWEKIDDPRLANEFAIMDALEEVCPEFNCAYASCNQAAGAVLSAVVDMDMTPHDNASGGPPTMLEWLRTHPENWVRIDSHDEADLLPGDVICGPGHTAIYVGHEAPQEKFPGTTGCIYEASYSAAAYAGIDGFWVSGDAEVYRPVKRNDNPQFQQIDYRAIIAANQD